MIMNQRGWTIPGCVGCLTASAALAAALLGAFRGVDARAAEETAAQIKAPADPALERTREQVKMLDDLYKNAVVSITKTYATHKDSQPAIMVAKQVFTAMRKQGWHSARLVDATGNPFNDENSPSTDFEKAAFKAIRAGKPVYEEVVGAGDNRRLLTATVVPVVMKECAVCHDAHKVGDVLGFLRYDLPIK